MKTALARLGLAALVASASACAPAVCDRNAQVDPSSKTGNCSGVFTSRLLGDTASCPGKVKACSSADQTALSTALDCLSKLATCSADTRDAWVASQQACLDPLSGLSQACKDSVFGGVTPGQDAGVDAGVDAGPQPITDGTNGLDLLGVADEWTLMDGGHMVGVAFAWSKRQAADVFSWELDRATDAGVTTFTQAISPGTLLAWNRNDTAGAGLAVPASYFFLLGLDPQGALVFGSLDGGGTQQVDAGPAQCTVPTDCPPDKVCDLNQCRTQTCQPGGVQTCPNIYLCYPNGTCNRQNADAGAFDSGVVAVDGGAPDRPLAFISNPVVVTSAPGTFQPDLPLGGFAGRRADMVAIDTARVFVALEQEGQIIGHVSSKRGADFGNDFGSTANIDTVGSRVKVTYNPESQIIYACYNVGRGVRVRRSTDFGRTWGAEAATVEPADDGGFSSHFSDCDIAPWKNGGAIMVTVDDDTLATRTVSNALSLSDPEYAFLSSAPDAGNIYAPAHPAIATLPADGTVHITFTGTRTMTNGVSDTEPYGVFRDGLTGGFSQPKFLSVTGVTAPGNGQPQDWTTVVIDPVTKRTLAAYTSLRPGPAGSTISTVYLSLFNRASQLWGTGADLDLFVENTLSATSYVFPAKTSNDRWFAFSPNLVALPTGRIFLSVEAGPITGLNGDYKVYVVEFDFEKFSPVSSAKGWFLPPAKAISQTRAFDPRVGSAAPPTVTSFAADQQLSVYSTFIEGLGAGDIEGRAIVNVRP